MSQRLRGARSLPVLGETIAVYRNPYQFATRHRARFGEVFVTNVVGNRTIVILNAEGQRHVLVSHQQNHPAGPGNDVLAPLLEDMLLLSDGTEHDIARRWVTPAFHNAAIATYVPAIGRVIDQQLATWGESGTIGIYPQAAGISFKISAALLLGIELGSDADRLLALWMRFASGVTGIIRNDSRFTAWGRARAARREIDALAAGIIAKQRAHGQPNMLQMLIDARDENGQAIPDATLINWVRFFLFAAFDTTTGTFSWLMVELLRNPEVLARVRAEVAGDPAAPIAPDEFKNKPFLDAIINETLRLYPQASQLVRGTITDDNFGEYAIRAGDRVMVIPAYTHRRPDYFADPHRFDPDRFLPPREEHKATPYAFIGFGGGPHACLGEGVARFEIKAMLTLLLRRYPTLTLLPNQDLSQAYIPLSRPKSALFVRYGMA